MSFTELFFTAVGLSMDAFAIAVCFGLSVAKPKPGQTLAVRQASLVSLAIITGLYFGAFQAAMPLIGYFAASRFTDNFNDYGYWVAFVLLCFIGGKMIYPQLKTRRTEDDCGDNEIPGGSHTANSANFLKPSHMLPLALATSIDALAMGVTFAFVHVGIIPAVLLIGATTFLLSALGTKIGSLFGAKFKSKAEIAGGAVLILIGFKILLENIL